MRWLPFVALAGCSAILDLKEVEFHALPDAGVVLEGKDSGVAQCPANAIACQDFEKTLSAPWRLDDNAKASEVVLDGSNPHGGSSSLRLTTPTGTGSGVVAFEGKTFATGQRAVIRAWMRLTKSLANASIIELRHTARGVSGGVSLKVIDGKLAYNVTSGALETRGSGVADAGLDLETWQCVRFTIDVGPTGHIKIERGNDVVLDAPTVDTLADATSWEAIWIGLPFVSEAAEVHVDDVVIANDTVSCE